MSEISVNVPRRTITSLTLRNRDGSTTPISGPVVLEAGRGVSLSLTDKKITIANPIGAQSDDPFYAEKYRSVVDGGSSYGVTGHLDYIFSDMAKYIATINGMTGHTAADTFFLMGGACWQVGCQNDQTDATTGDGEHALRLENKCFPGLDCRDYQVIKDYLERIRIFLQENRDKNCCKDAKLFEQYKALIHYWNWLVASRTAGTLVKAIYSGIAIAAHYEHWCCDHPASSSPGSSGAAPSSSSSSTIYKPKFTVGIQQISCLGLPIRFFAGATDVTTKPEYLPHVFAEGCPPDAPAGFAPNLCWSCEVSDYVMIFGDMIDIQAFFAVQLVLTPDTQEAVITALKACGGEEGAIHFQVVTQWLDVCPEAKPEVKDVWVKLLLDPELRPLTVWQCASGERTD